MWDGFFFSSLHWLAGWALMSRFLLHGYLISLILSYHRRLIELGVFLGLLLFLLTVATPHTQANFFP